MRWYLSQGGNTTGPLDAATLKGWLASNNGSGAYVRDESGGAWQPIQQSPFAAFVPTQKARPAVSFAGPLVAGIFLGLAGFLLLGPLAAFAAGVGGFVLLSVVRLIGARS